MRRSLVRGLIALGVGLVALVVLIATTSRPKLYSVITVTQPVAAGSVISPNDLGSVSVASVPSGAVTDARAVVGKYAETPLYPGETLSASAVGSTYGIGHGLVNLTIPVSPAQSGLVLVGDYVDVIGEVSNPNAGTTAAVLPVVSGVRVTGVYTSSAAPITAQSLATSSSTSSAPALVSLAVTPAQAEKIAAYAGQNGDSVWLVDDPARVGFGGSSTVSTSPPTGATSGSVAPASTSSSSTSTGN